MLRFSGHCREASRHEGRMQFSVSIAYCGFVTGTVDHCDYSAGRQANAAKAPN